MTRCSCISSVIGNNEIPTNSTSSDSGQVLKIETIVFLHIKEMFLSKKLMLLVLLVLERTIQSLDYGSTTFQITYAMLAVSCDHCVNFSVGPRILLLRSDSTD